MDDKSGGTLITHLSVIESFHGAFESRPQRCEADHDVNVGMTLHGVVHGRVHCVAANTRRTNQASSTTPKKKSKCG